MHPYQNPGNNSGVTAYETGADYIKVEFMNDDVYLYTYASTGRRDIEQMKRLAGRGEGLSTFISQHVRDRYAAKLR